jgi:aminoglycoside phosphotransferase (APT) family kinase protein
MAVQIDDALVGRRVAGQFPQWSELPLRPIEPSGWDNRTFRLGDAMLVRLPSGEQYAEQVAKE